MRCGRVGGGGAAAAAGWLGRQAGVSDAMDGGSPACSGAGAHGRGEKNVEKVWSTLYATMSTQSFGEKAFFALKSIWSPAG